MNPKHKAELAYQKDWVNYFKTNKHLVLEYWKTIRYFDTILDICKPNENSNILDVGCGISSILHFLPGKKTGIDSLADVYKELYTYPQDLNILKADCESLPFENNQFDIIFCTNAYDHFNNLDSANKEIYRVLKPNGFFILAVEIFYKTKDRGIEHPYCLSKPNLFQYLIKYKYLFEKEIPWVGLREYIQHKQKTTENELLLVLQKDGN
jgi:ubiquinone/menaquinone biosynthesis C-methylase UbiE